MDKVLIKTAVVFVLACLMSIGAMVYSAVETVRSEPLPETAVARLLLPATCKDEKRYPSEDWINCMGVGYK